MAADRLRLLFLLGWVALFCSCRKPSEVGEQAPVRRSNGATNDAIIVDTDRKPPNRVDIGASAVDLERWLTVEKIRGDAPGAWATGSFLGERNRIVIDTNDVARFSIDVTRIPIRWDKLVVIRIDGRNSELVKRDQAIYRFALDEHGQWVVLKP